MTGLVEQPKIQPKIGGGKIVVLVVGEKWNCFFLIPRSKVLVHLVARVLQLCSSGCRRFPALRTIVIGLC